MGYKNESNGQHVNAVDVVLLASAARAGAGATNGDWLDVGEAHTLRLVLTCSALAGTDETLDCAVQTRRDPSDASPRTVGSFTQQLAAATERKAFSGLDRQVRVVATLGGTGSPTYTAGVSGELVG